MITTKDVETKAETLYSHSLCFLLDFEFVYSIPSTVGLTWNPFLNLVTSSQIFFICAGRFTRLQHRIVYTESCIDCNTESPHTLNSTMAWEWVNGQPRFKLCTVFQAYAQPGDLSACHDRSLWFETDRLFAQLGKNAKLRSQKCTKNPLKFAWK